MAVTGQHERLVGHIISWVEEHHSLSGDVCIYADHIDWPSNHKPTQVGGFVPDVYAVGVTQALTIIGEAETIKGIDSPHTKLQIDAFLDFLRLQTNPILVLAVPWAALPTARGLVRNLIRRHGNPAVGIVFLERLE